MCHRGGDDAWPGSSEQPFKSLERARDELRAIEKEGCFGEGGLDEHLSKVGISVLAGLLRFQRRIRGVKRPRWYFARRRVNDQNLPRRSPAERLQASAGQRGPGAIAARECLARSLSLISRHPA